MKDRANLSTSALVKPSTPNLQLSRRMLLKGVAATAAAGVGGLVLACSKGGEGAAPAGSGPGQPGAAASRGVALGLEQPEVRIGFVAVQSGAPIIIAYEKGFFKKHGLSVSLSKENGWTAARDKVVTGENQASHLKYAQPIASTMGLFGSPKIPMVAPWTLCRNGSVFMVASSYKHKLSFDPNSWKAVADEYRSKGEALTIALPLPFGWHGLMYRHFLANAGINADKELKLITLPPAQMVQNIKIGQMQACAMVEPWGYRGVHDNVTVITMYGQEMWKDHPIKSLGMLESWADKHPKTARAIVRAIAEAAAWCDNFDNRPELAQIISTPTYMNSSPESILAPLLGNFDYGDGRKLSDKTQAIQYYQDNYPQARDIKWFISQFRRWGMTQGEPDYDGLAQKVGRPDIFNEVQKELGAPAQPPIDAAIRLWDGTLFEHNKAREFAKSFAVHNLQG